MKNKLIYLLFFLISLSIVSATNLTCQYQETVKTGKQISVLNVFGEYKTEFLEIKNIKTFYDYPTPRYLSYFELHNTLEIPVDVEVRFLSNGNTIVRNELIEAKNYVTIGNYENLDINNITYIYKSNDYAVSDWIDEEIEQCKQCLGKSCLNDGVACTNLNECGGGYCVKGKCNNKETCYNNDCACSINELQCTDNARCVKKGDTPIDVKPSCNLNEECITGYIDTKTNLCAKSPTQLRDEETQRLKEELVRKEAQTKLMTYTIITLVSLIIIGSILIWYLKNKHENEKQKTEYAKQKTEESKRKTLQKEMDVVVAKLDKETAYLKELEEKIEKIGEAEIIENHKKKSYEQLLNERKETQRKIEETTQEIELKIKKQWKTICTPFPDSQVGNRLVFRNPFLGGYLCFYDKALKVNEYSINSLVHRWVWKKHNGRWPRLGYHIHHKDGDKYNNNPNNLEEINGEEHFEMHSRY